MVRTVIDPVTRIGGHLRVELEVNNNVITDAWVSSTLFRGFEEILKDRAPQDAFYISQRISGVSPISHGHTCSAAVDSAFKVTIPNNARIIRNIVEGSQFLHSHILWFYNMALLDWVDVSQALKADIAATYSLAEQAGTSPADFAGVQAHLKNLADGGQLSIFTNAWFNNPAYAATMPPELALIGMAHYLDALHYQAEASTISAIIGGKMPHIMTSIPGGTAFVPTDEKLERVLQRFMAIRDWIQDTMVPDTLALAPYYPEALNYGKGVGRFLAYGVFDRESRQPEDRYLPSGVIAEGLNLSSVDETKILEYVDRSFYAPYPQGVRKGLSPSVGITRPVAPKYDTRSQNGKYTWAKAPRYDGKAMEVGGLSRVLVAYLRGVSPVKDLVDTALAKLGASGKPEVLISALGRTLARPLEALYVANTMIDLVNELVASLKGGDSRFFQPYADDEGAGVGMWEAPQGALLHAINVKGRKIQNYQCVAPSTWNVSPRNADSNIRGPLEEALVGVPCADPKQPLEALRTVHSFDPCATCAVHAIELKEGSRPPLWTGPGGVR
jgi:Ni,Fe-hydrogenase I large subunit